MCYGVVKVCVVGVLLKSGEMCGVANFVLFVGKFILSFHNVSGIIVSIFRYN